MFRVFVSLVTAATVLGHAIVGCCGHHDHADHEHSPAVVHHEVAEHDHGSHDCCEHPASAPDDHAPPASPCEGERCSFAVGAIVKASDLDLVPTSFLSVAERAAVAFVVAALTCDPATPLDDRPPPLRRHLALGVLLI